MIDQFTTWLQAKQPEIQHIGTLLSKQLSAEPSELIEDLTAVEAWNSRVNELKAHCNAFLDRSKLYYMPEAGDMREGERKAIVDNAVADIRKTRDILEGMADAIKQRLILGESILRFERPMMTPEIKQPRTAADFMRGQ